MLRYLLTMMVALITVPSLAAAETATPGCFEVIAPAVVPREPETRQFPEADKILRPSIGPPHAQASLLGAVKVNRCTGDGFSP
jgi:hypothetical protein